MVSIKLGVAGGTALAVVVLGLPAGSSATTTPIAVSVLTDSHVTAKATFGSQLAASNDLVAVLAPGGDFVDVYPRSPAGWTSATPSAVLTFGPDEANEGSAIAVSDDTVFVGHSTADPDNHASQGEIVVFSEPATGWKSTSTPSATLTADDGAPGYYLGYSLAASGNTVVAGETGYNSGQGAADVFVEPPGGWSNGTQTAELTGTSTVAGDSFGSGVAIDGDTIAVGAEDHMVSSVADAGLVYVFTKSGNAWATTTQNRKLEAQYPEAGAYLGRRTSVAVVGDSVATSDNFLNQVDVWTEPTAGWGAAGTSGAIDPTGTIPDPDGNAMDYFGSNLTSDGVRLGISSNVAQGGGALLLYTEPAGTWAQAATATPVRVTSPDPETGAEFSYASVVTSGLLAVDAPYQTVDGQTQAGEIFLFAAARPALSTVKQSHKTWTLGKHTHHTNVKHKPSGGTTFSFSLNEAATVTMTFTEENKHHKYVSKGTITVKTAAGKTKEYVDGPLGHGKKLTATTAKPGHCKVAITATNANGISSTQTLGFIVKATPKHKKKK